MDHFIRIRALVLSLMARLQWLPPALARLTLGIVFLHSGWWKFHHRPQVTAFFTSLHLPAPAFQALFVASTEWICGGLLLAGLATRLATVPLLGVMTVAISLTSDRFLAGTQQIRLETLSPTRQHTHPPCRWLRIENEDEDEEDEEPDPAMKVLRLGCESFRRNGSPHVDA